MIHQKVIRTFVLICIFFFTDALTLTAQMNNDSLLHIIQSSDSKQDKMQASADYAFQLCRIKPDSAIYYAKQAVSLATELQDEKTLMSAYNVLGLTYATKGIYALSIQNFNKALEHNLSDSYDRAQIYHNMALTYRRMRNNKEALKSELSALEINDKDSLLTGVIYQTLCNIYRDLNDFAPAEEYILKSIDIFKSMPDGPKYNRMSLLANSYNGYGSLLQVSGELDRAVEMHQLSVDLHTASGDLYNKAIAYENLGTDYFLQKEYDKAIAAYNGSRELMAGLDSETDVGYEMLNIAAVYQEQKKFAMAMATTDSAIVKLNTHDADAYLMDAYKLKYELYDDNGEPAQALVYYKKFITLKDSIDVAGQNDEMLRLKEEYETSQKEQQISLLQTENTLKEKETQHQKLLRNIALAGIVLFIVIGFLLFNRYQIKQQAKELQLRNNIALDLHDDVGSTLSSIRMYSNIVNTQIRDKSPESLPLLQKMSDNSKEMIENMSDIVWAIKPDNDAFKNIESRMLNFAVELCNARNIELDMERNEALDGLKIQMEERKDLYLIFKEAVNNAVKYSGCSKLTIRFSRNEHYLQMEILDNGKGFDTQTIKEGNGLGSMRKRAVNNKAVLNIASSENAGTVITLKMPLT